MKYITIIFLVLFSPLLLNAQSTEAVQLKMELLNAREDSVRIKILIRLSWLYAWSFPDSCLKFSMQGLKLAEQTGLEEIQIDFLTARAQAFPVKAIYRKLYKVILKP
jgi:hypothetical protein